VSFPLFHCLYLSSQQNCNKTAIQDKSYIAGCFIAVSATRGQSMTILLTIMEPEACLLYRKFVKI